MLCASCRGYDMIQLENVTFTYNGSEEKGNLKNINLSIRQGEVILLCGESGCGKTTLTRLINGLIPWYYEGELNGIIKVDGKEIREQPLHILSRKIGSVFQNPQAASFLMLIPLARLRLVVKIRDFQKMKSGSESIRRFLCFRLKI